MRYLHFIIYILFTLNISAQNFIPDATIWKNPWISCDKTMNPKAEYGATHWIQYDLGTVRKLSRTWVWNINDPAKLDQGFREVKIDYSQDGRNWTFLGNMTFPKGTGTAVYGGFEGPNLINVEARYILLTAVNTHAGNGCAGISEIKFNLLPPISVDDLTTNIPVENKDFESDMLLYPNPTKNLLHIRMNYAGKSQFSVFSIDGRLIYDGQINTIANKSLAMSTRNLGNGIYILRIENGQFIEVKKFVVAR